jgi:hypothetical protein
MNCMRPDIAYSVNKFSRYTSNPGKDPWKAIIRVFKYLRYTKDFGLHYTRYPAILEGYSDANWISDTKDSKSTSGYVFTIGVQQYLGDPLNKHILLDPLWNLNL